MAFGLAAIALGLVLIAASVLDPALAPGPRLPMAMPFGRAAAAAEITPDRLNAAPHIGEARTTPHQARAADDTLATSNDLGRYQQLAIAVQSHQRQALENARPSQALPAISSILVATASSPSPGHGALTSSATGPWVSPLYPQNGITLWDRIRRSNKRDLPAFLLGTAIQVHTPLVAATPGVWSGAGPHPGGVATPTSPCPAADGVCHGDIRAPATSPAPT
jgi:hypothetical protein